MYLVLSFIFEMKVDDVEGTGFYSWMLGGYFVDLNYSSFFMDEFNTCKSGNLTVLN